MPNEENIVLLIVVAAIACIVTGLVGVVANTFMVQMSCWLYNKVNGAAAPGLGRRDSRDYALYAPPKAKFYKPPAAFARFDRGNSASRGVPVPGFLKAFLLTLAFTFATIVAAGSMVGVFAAAAAATGSTNEIVLVLGSAISVPIYVALLALTLTVFLPTRFLRGALIAGLHLLIAVAVAAVVATAVLAIAALVDPTMWQGNFVG